MAKKNKEEVSVSFHSLIRQKKSKNKELESVEISLDEFQLLIDAIKRRPKCDMGDDDVLTRLRYGLEVSLESSKVINERTFFGVYRAPYTGHAFDNSAKGKISADSVNLRPFHYLLYLGISGKIYLGSQYLGHYGAYQAISNTIRGMMLDGGTVHSQTFRLDAYDYQNIDAKEVKVTFVKKPAIISSKNLFGTGGMIAVKKVGKDDGFEQKVAERLFPLIGRRPETIKMEVAKLLSENELFEVSDDDIENCTVIANVNGKQKTIYLLEGGNFATKFPISVPLNEDGHPLYEETQSAMLKVLQEQIIAQAQNV